VWSTHPPPPLGQRGRGLWIIRQLTDVVAVRTGEDGTTVRIELSPDPHIGA
jgi:anti-sigma regulatory factor (Ser/Thr protein kinase)